MSRLSVVVVVVAVFLGALCMTLVGTASAGLSVAGNKILADGQPIRLLGVDKMGTEYACIQGWGFFDGPADQSFVDGVKSWYANIVRVPLNEDCWLGINGVKPEYGGANYQQTIVNFVNLLVSNGLYVILDMHWTSPGGNQATGQNPMPDMDHTVTAWASIAKTFGDNTNVIFDLFNEPYPDNGNWNSQAGWECWLNGGWCNGVGYQVAGMQTLVDTVRGAGAQNIIMIGGLSWSNSLAQWLEYKPKDPLNNLVASWHSYATNYCNNQNCWEQYVAPVAEQVPLIVGELGEYDCGSGYISQLLPWLDSINAHYLAWSFNVCSCSGPCLLSAYPATPNSMGQVYKDHLATQ